MAENVLYPIADAEAMVEKFLDGSLSPGEFSHEAHLITGLCLLARHGDGTLGFIRQKLMDFLAAAGIPNTDTSGYHETMTSFWLHILQKEFADGNGQVHWNQATLDELLFSEKLANRNLWLEHYSKERMMSVEARKGLVEPDLKPLD